MQEAVAFKVGITGAAAWVVGTAVSVAVASGVDLPVAAKAAVTVAVIKSGLGESAWVAVMTVCATGVRAADQDTRYDYQRSKSSSTRI